MAKYNEILVGRFNRFLQKLTQIKGTAPAPQLAGEIVPALPLFSGVENRYLESWDTFASLLDQAAVAAQFNAFQIRNPSSSNVVAVVSKILIAVPVAGTSFSAVLSTGLTGTDLGSPGPLPAVDTRSRPSSNTIVSLGTQASQTHLTNQIARATFIVGGSPNYDLILFENEELPLLPGAAYRVVCNIANIETACSFWIRERFLEESERT